MTQIDYKPIDAAIKSASEPFRRLTDEVHKVLVGQENMWRHMLIGILSNGHVLLEGVPGLAKTLTVSCLARGIDTGFRRLQFTPDLLPADLIGTMIYQPQTGEFKVKKGPIFSNIILADEINRAPAKVQSALLEAMQERQVTIGDTTHALPDPFLVLATQNPIEQEGTYPLPEAQVDRFMLKLLIRYPTKEEEKSIIDRMGSSAGAPVVEQATTPEAIVATRKVLDSIYVDDKVKSYVVDLVFATRDPAQIGLEKLRPLILYGASPRASLALTRAARARAFLEGRGFVTPQDIKAVGYHVLRHRVITTYEAEAEEISSEDILRQIFDNVPVP